MERAGRLPLLARLGAGRGGAGRRRAAALACALAAALAPGVARATVYTTQPQALAEAFPGARIERVGVVLTDAEVRAVRERARVRFESRLVTLYHGWRGDTLAGTAVFDSRTVRTMPGVFMVVVGPDSTIARVDVLAFHEPADYRPPARWLARFGGHRLDDRLWPQRDIRNLSGSTLTTRAVTESARLALALWEIVAVPRLARAGPGRTAR